MINKKEDLIGTYVKTRDDELLSLYIDKCLSFGFVLSPAFSGKKLLDERFDYAVLGIDGDCVWAVSMNYREMKRELTLEDLTPQTNIETPEEKEALDLIDTTPHQYESVASKEVEWVNGDKCRYNDINWLFCGFHPANSLAIVANNDEPSSHQVITVDVNLLSKPETPQQREERERTEAIYEMCSSADNFTEESHFWAGKFYDLGYRKEG